MKTKMTRREKEEGEEGKLPWGNLCIEVPKPVQLGAAFRSEERLIAKEKNVIGNNGEKAQCS